MLSLALLLSTSILAAAQCPPLGSTLPVASSYKSNTNVSQTVQVIQQTLQNLTDPLNSTAFAITLGTVNETLLEFTNNPTVYNTSGAHNLTTDTQFAVASISKLFTAYGIKLLGEWILPSDPITKFVPELLELRPPPAQEINAITTTDWCAITIEALLSHLADIPEDLGDSDIDNSPGNGNYSALGLPALNTTQEGTMCGSSLNPYQRPCTWRDFFENWGKKYPVYAPFTTPVYSNVGYALLGLVIERVTGQNYTEFVQEAIACPLGLNHTSVNAPLSLGDAFITEQTGDGDLSQGFDASSGGLYSSSSDLFALGRAILSSAQLSPAQTRAWLKPRTFTSSSGTFVGEVWEIARGTNLTGGDGHIVDAYTKGGNLNLYSSLIALVPDYDLVFSLTSAGPDTSSGLADVVFSEILTALVPAFEVANKAEAKEKYAGTYTTANNDSITLEIDSGPGLLVTNFSVNGVSNVIDAVGELEGASGPGQTTLRLYPTNLIAGKQRAWQAVYDTTPQSEVASEDALLFFAQGSCETWSEIALTSYGLRPLDQFIFTEDEGGKNVQVDARAWRTVLTRG